MQFQVIGYWGGYPGPGSATAGYLLEHDGEQLLLDCGSGVLSRLPYFTQPERLQAVLLSHYHYDHIADLGVLQYALLVQQQLGNGNGVLPIYAPNHDEEAFQRLQRPNITQAFPLLPDKKEQIGLFQVEVLPTQHPEYCLAMRIATSEATIVYTADTAFFPKLVDFAADADLLVAECSFYGGMDAQAYGGHMNSYDVGRLAAEARVGSLLLTHLPHFGQHDQLLEEAAEHFTGPIALAREGWRWEAR
ncbi:MBL fold metallo-hydrolase [Rubeoparvulum massiliense]|uniref:MBL fold metallo-hydrolase n=1 Tax=Rubeoparvulum massiliense TaxID=1631346 RepID=UPI00065E9B4A|nr:MBL fold metallo-hydrolase [Rubeoparvulum massiliense]